MEALKTVWNFIQDEVLGMNWLDRLLATILNAVGLDTTGKIGSSIHFFRRFPYTDKISLQRFIGE